LYGRYWGCTEEVPHLHFEICYYQAIDAAIGADCGAWKRARKGSIS
jgi:predicted N-acyltransferase